MGQAGEGGIPAGKPGGEGACERLERGTHSLQGESAAPGGCWLLVFLLGAVCCEKLLCWHHNVLSGCLGFCCCEPSCAGLEEALVPSGDCSVQQHLVPAGKVSVRDGGFATVPPGLHREGFVVFSVALAAGTGGTWSCCSLVSLSHGTENGSN